MPINLACPNCRTAFSFADELRGHTVRCNTCRATFVVTASEPEDMRSAPREQRLREKPQPSPATARRTVPVVPVVPVARPRRQPAERPRSGAAIAILLIGGLAAGLLLLVGIGLGAWLLLRPAATASSAVATVDEAGEAIDVPPLRYRWQGAPHTYHVRVEVDRADHFEVHEGNCVFNVTPAVRRRKANAAPEKGSGTGFVVNPNGYLLTCAHVVSDATKIEVTVGGKKYPAQVVGTNPAADVAVIRVAAQNMPALALANSDAAELGQDVWVLGYPLSDMLGNNLKVTRGTLSGLNVKNGRKDLQVDATMTFGNSGGPLVSETGLVLGVNKGGISGAGLTGNINFAAAINDAKRLLTAKGVAYSADGWTTKLDGPTLVKRVSAATAFIEVTLGESADDQSYVVTCQGQLQKSLRAKPGTNFMPPPPGFAAGGRSTRVEVDALGNVRHATGEIQMPCLLGDVAQFLIDPLSDDDSPTWEQKNKCTISENAGGAQGGFAFGPRGLPGMPGVPRPPFGPRFGPGGMPGRQPETIVRVGEEHAVYARQPGAGDTVTIRKTYDLTVPPSAGRSSLDLNGNGTISFDVKMGLPRSVDFTATLNVISGNTNVRTPVTVSYKLLDPGERDRVAQAPAPQVPAPPPPAEAAPKPAAVPHAPAAAPRVETQKLVGDVPPLRPPDAIVPLAGPATGVTVAGGGKFLIFHLPARSQLAVFDVTAGKIVRSIPAPEEKLLFAAGRDDLVVFLPEANQFQRWSLATGERTATAPNPLSAEIKLLAMGAASAGPLVVLAPPKSPSTLGLLLYDPQTFKPLTDSVDAIPNQHFGVKADPNVACLSCSADGGMIVARGTFNFTTLTRQGAKWRAATFRGNNPLPSSDGQVVIDNGVAYTPEGHPLGTNRSGHQHAVWCMPAAQAGLTLAFNEAFESAESPKQYLKVTIHQGGDAAPLVTLPAKIDTLAELVDWFFGRPQPFERHVFFVPEAGTLVVIPTKKDRIELYRFDLDQLLAAAKGDYLFVLSQPVTAAQAGTAYRYPITVKSKTGGVTFSLTAAPPGMTVSPQGVLTWTPPANFTGDWADVSVTVRDGAGKEAVQTFRVRVAAKK